jgi:tetratricopeptide (TPR) repeat protein
MNPQIVIQTFSKAIIFAAILSAVLPSVLAQPGNQQSVSDAIPKRKNYNEQISDYTDAIVRNPNDAELYYARAEIYFRLEDFDKAIEDSSKAIELNPKHTKAFGVRSDSYCRIGKWKESTADIKRYEQLTGKWSRATCYIRLLDNLKYCAETDDDCRMDIYNAGISNPGLINSLPLNLGDFYAGRGFIYYKRADFESAFSDFENADKYFYYNKLKPIELYLGKQLLIKGKYNEALIHLRRAVPESEAHLGIGEIYLVKREYEKALENYEKALFLNPRLSKAYLGRGIIYLEYAKNYGEFENDAIKAAEFYRKAVKELDSVIEIDLSETQPEVYLKRAKAYERLGEKEKAEFDRQKHRELTDKA